jgi:hypothetical protein
MLQRPDNLWKPAGRRDSSGKMLLMVNGIIVLVLLILALGAPSASEWISNAVQAEFVGSGISGDLATRIAQPAEQTRLVRSN